MYNTVPALRWNEIFFQSFILFAIFFSLSYRRGLLVDKRSEPRPSERVPYVIVYGSPGQSLIQLVRTPGDLLANPGLRLNGVYYVTKQILPALDRAFSLLGVNVRQW